MDISRKIDLLDSGALAGIVPTQFPTHYRPAEPPRLKTQERTKWLRSVRKSWEKSMIAAGLQKVDLEIRKYNSPPKPVVEIGNGPEQNMQQAASHIYRAWKSNPVPKNKKPVFCNSEWAGRFDRLNRMSDVRSERESRILWFTSLYFELGEPEDWVLTPVGPFGPSAIASATIHSIPLIPYDHLLDARMLSELHGANPPVEINEFISLVESRPTNNKLELPYLRAVYAHLSLEVNQRHDVSRAVIYAPPMNGICEERTKE